MSWLSNREIEYLYRSDDGEEIIIEESGDRPDQIHMNNKVYFFKEMLPYKCNLTVRIAYEQNGLKAYQVRTGDGKPSYISATALEYEKKYGGKSKAELRGAKVEQVYSKSVQKMKDQQKLSAEKRAKKRK